MNILRFKFILFFSYIYIDFVFISTLIKDIQCFIEITSN